MIKCSQPQQLDAAELNKWHRSGLGSPAAMTCVRHPPRPLRSPACGQASTLAPCSRLLHSYSAVRSHRAAQGLRLAERRGGHARLEMHVREHDRVAGLAGEQLDWGGYSEERPLGTGS